MRPDLKFCLIAALLCTWPLSAGADDSEMAKLIAECSAPDLPQSSVDSCLERVRVLDETEPSARLQSLEGGLEKRRSGQQFGASAARAHGPDTAEVGPVPGAMPQDMEVEHVSEGANQDSTAPPSSSGAEDQPPVGDPPDATPSNQPADGQPDDPEPQL